MEDPVSMIIKPARMEIEVAGHKGAVTYNASEQSVEGYDLNCSSQLYDKSKIVFSGMAKAKGTEVGTYPMNLSDKQFRYSDTNIDVQFNITDGYLIINPKPDPDKIIISVIGKSDSQVYNKEEQSISGYELFSGSEGFDPDKVEYRGTAQAIGTDVGKYPMNLSADDFSYNDTSIKANFIITDGELNITPAPMERFFRHVYGYR